jgi:hypothetical protein
MGFIPVRALLGRANVEETSRFLGLETNSNPTRRDELPERKSDEICS